MDSYLIKANTAQMRRIANDLKAEIEKAMDVFEELNKTVQASSVYWEGEGANSHLNSYMKKLGEVQPFIQAYLDGASSLNEIADIFDETETANIAMAEELPDEVI